MNICSVCQQCYDDSVTICTVENHGSLTQARKGNCLMVEGFRIDLRIESSSPVELYEATHLASEKSVLIRFISEDESTAELQNHLQAVAGINHPNLARVFEFGNISENELFVVLEAISEQSLQDYLETSSPLTEKQAIKIARQIAEGLEELHAAEVIHQAVNPANIYFTNLENEDFEIKLQNYDFGGIVQKAVASGANGVNAKTDILRYFSPEQFTDEKADFKSDIYSLAVVFYEMLLGCSPYEALNPHAISSYVFKERVVEKLHFDLRALLSYTLRQALQHRLDFRPPTTNNFVRQLRHLELIANPHSHSLQPQTSNQSSQKQAINIIQPNKLKPIEKQFVAEATISSSEFVAFETPKEDLISKQIDVSQIEIADENKPVFDPIEQKELEDFSALESLTASQGEIVNESIDDEVTKLQPQEDQQELIEQTENCDSIFFDKSDFAESENSLAGIYISNEDFVENKELEIFLTESIAYEEPKPEKKESYQELDRTLEDIKSSTIIESDLVTNEEFSEDVLITNDDFDKTVALEAYLTESTVFEEIKTENQEEHQELIEVSEDIEYGVIDEFDRVESQHFVEDIHITNEDIHITNKDVDDDDPQQVIYLGESVDYEEPEAIKKPGEKESPAERHIMNSFGTYAQAHSFAINKTFLYILGIMVLTVFGSFITVSIFDWQSDAASSRANPSADQNISEQKKESVSQDKIQEIKDVAEQDSDTLQIQSLQNDDFQRTDKTIIQPTSEKSSQNVEVSKTKNNTLPPTNKERNKQLATEKKVPIKSRPADNQVATSQDKRKEKPKTKQDKEKTQPTVEKPDGKTRPRIVTNVKVNN